MIATSCYSRHAAASENILRHLYETQINTQCAEKRFSAGFVRVGRARGWGVWNQRQHWVTNCKWSVIDSAASVANDRWQYACNVSRCATAPRYLATNANTRFLFSIDFFRHTKEMRSLLWVWVGVCAFCCSCYIRKWVVYRSVAALAMATKAKIANYGLFIALTLV